MDILYVSLLFYGISIGHSLRFQHDNAISGEGSERDSARIEQDDLSRNIRARFQCRQEDQRCRHLPPCCGNMTCYRPQGYSLRTGGTCVKCIKEGAACQRDDQCCPNFQCNSGNALWIDGVCERYRRSGGCYRDGQCVNKCVKEWYATQGQCT